MRLLILALSLPIMFTAMGFAALLLPQCGIPASLAAAYLALIPVVYYAKPFKIKPKYFAISLLMFAGVWAVELALEPLLSRYNAMTEALLQLLAQCPQWKIYFFITAVVLAPLVEETIFRAMLYAELEKRAGALVGYVGNSLAFAAVHGLPYLIPLYFVYGVILTFAFKRGGVVSAMALHGINNFLALLPLVSS